MPTLPVNSLMELSALDPEARICPHGKLKQLREATPAMRDEGAKVWMLTRYDDVRATVNDRSMWRHPALAEDGSIARLVVDESEREDGVSSILFLDEPDHSRVRLPLAKAFYARVNAMKTDIDAIVDDVIDAAPLSGTFDLMEEIAVPLPIAVIGRILGVASDRLSEFRKWSEGVILSLNPLRTEAESERLAWAVEKIDAYFTELMAQRRQDPRDDLISDMVKLQADGLPLSDDELRINLQALLVGGNLTTTDLIGNGVWLLLTHPAELAKLKADPGLAGSTVEEVLRYESPVAITSRVVPDERQIAGCPMHARQSVWMSLQSANRDEAVFEDPDAFDISREHVSHVAFGGGSHICIGAPLARIEARRVFARLFEKYLNVQLPDQELTWRTLPFFRGLETLTVEV